MPIYLSTDTAGGIFLITKKALIMSIRNVKLNNSDRQKKKKKKKSIIYKKNIYIDGCI
jgi:hypothetical protein